MTHANQLRNAIPGVTDEHITDILESYAKMHNATGGNADTWKDFISKIIHNVIVRTGGKGLGVKKKPSGFCSACGGGIYLEGDQCGTCGGWKSEMDNIQVGDRERFLKDRANERTEVKPIIKKQGSRFTPKKKKRK